MRHNSLFTISTLFVFIALMTSGCSKEEPAPILKRRHVFNRSLCDFPEKLDSAISLCHTSSNLRKSIAVFGGSISSRPESEYSKDLWRLYLISKVTTYGIDGYGFSNQALSIQDQVEAAEEHDIYILWCSTNDFTRGFEAGEPTDYSIADHYNENKRSTQCGGLNYCIHTLQKKSPKSRIFIFCSLPFFTMPSGWLKDEKYGHNRTGHNLYHYVTKQIETANYNHIAYLQQFEYGDYLQTNISRYFQADSTHLTYEGYAAIAAYQLAFIATH